MPFFSISFLTTPNSGSNYLVANDTDGGPVFLEITMSGPAPLTPGGFINVVNGAVINW